MRAALASRRGPTLNDLKGRALEQGEIGLRLYAVVGALSCALVLALSFALQADAARSESGSTYFVGSAGNDASDGRTPATSWRTLARVAAAPLEPGDRVLFRGGDVFSETLKTSASGSEQQPIAFASYGTGRALIASPAGAAVYLRTNHWLSFDSLDLAAPAAACVLLSSGGGGSSDISLSHLAVHDCGGAGLNSDNPLDTRVSLTDSTITRTQDSGVFFVGSRFRISRNQILETGMNASGAFTWPLHGIYAKGPEPTITQNTIVDFQTAGITIRSSSSDVEQNTIVARTRGMRGISYYQETANPGTTTIARNTISGVSLQGIAIDHGSTTDGFGGDAKTASTSESFVISENQVGVSGGQRPSEGIRLFRVVRATLSRNRVGGTCTRVLNAYGSTASYWQAGNEWGARPGDPAFAWNSATLNFAAFKAASSQGSGDKLFRTPKS